MSTIDQFEIDEFAEAWSRAEQARRDAARIGRAIDRARTPARLFRVGHHRGPAILAGPTGHHPSCPARDGSGPCLGCGVPTPSVPAPRPASSTMSEREARYHSWGVTR